MELSPEAIEDFKRTWKLEYNEEISDEYARERAQSFANLIEFAIAVPIEAITTVDNWDALDRALEIKRFKEQTGGKDSPEIMRRLRMYFQTDEDQPEPEREQRERKLIVECQCEPYSARASRFSTV